MTRIAARLPSFITSPARVEKPLARPVPAPSSTRAPADPPSPKREAVEAALRKGDLSLVSGELSGPRGEAMQATLRALWKERPTLRDAITDVFLRVPQRWTHVDAFELGRHTAGLRRERAVIDAQLGLASGSRPPDWAVYRSVELAAAGNPEALSVVRRLAASGRSDVKELIRHQGRSSSARPEAAGLLLLETQQALPIRLRDALAESLSRHGPSKELLGALTTRATQGDDGAIDVLLATRSTDRWLAAARRDVFDTTKTPGVKERFAESVASSGVVTSPAEIRRLMEALAAGSRTGYPALAKAIEFLPASEAGLQGEAAQVLERAALSGHRDAAEALLAVPVDFSLAPQVLTSMASVAAASGKPGDATRVLDALELPLRYRSEGAHEAAVAAFQRLASHAEPRHLDALTKALASETIHQRATGTSTPAAEVLAQTLSALPRARRDLALRSLEPLDAGTMGRLVDALGSRTTSSERRLLESAVTREAEATPPYQGLPSTSVREGVQALLRHAATDPTPDLAVFALTTPAIFKRLTDAEHEAIGELAARGTDAAKRSVLAVTKPTEGMPELTSRAGQYQTALVTALRGAQRGTPLGDLAVTLSAIALAEKPEHRGRVDVAAAYRKVESLLADPSIVRALETLRATVNQPGDERVFDRVVRSMTSGAGKARLASLPPEAAARELLGARELLRQVAPSHAKAIEQLTARHVLDTAKVNLSAMPTPERDAAIAQLGLAGISPAELATETLGLAEKFTGLLAKDSTLAKALKLADVTVALAGATSGSTADLVDAGAKVGELAVTGLEKGAAALGLARTAAALGAIGSGLSFYDSARDLVDGLDDWANNGDTAGGVSKLVSSAGAAALAISALGTGGWSLLILGGAALIGGKVGDATLGESEQLGRLRQLGLYR